MFVSETEQILSEVIFRIKYDSGVNVIQKDWDNLIILDACRADFFARYNEIDGECQTVISQGSRSKEFIDANFQDKELHDTIYITANPFVERLSDDVFFKVYYSELINEWDNQLKTIPPEAVVEATVQMHEQYPNKRLITHLMQPHAPYIGSTGQELYERYEFGVFNPKFKTSEEFGIAGPNIPAAIKNGPIQENELRQAYKENVQIAIKSAQELIEQISGKSIITADHGEMLGERIIVSKEYGHGSVVTPELRVVPWHIVDSENRRDVTEDEPEEFIRLDEDIREDRLKALGYI